MSSAGRFEVKVWRGGYPVQCELLLDGRIIGRVKHSDLADLRYAAERAMKEAILALPEEYRDEV